MGKVVLTAAIMDLLHEGHQNLLREMRKKAGVDGMVIVVLHSDLSCFRIKGKFPVWSLQRRADCLQDSGLADEAYVTEDDDPAAVFDQIHGKHKVDLFMRGDDNPDFPGKHQINKEKIPIKLIPYTKGVSSTQLREALK